MNASSKFIRIGLLACFASFPLSAFGQAPAGPVRITLDEAIQMALQHNHNIIAARTAIDQSLALEMTAHLRPNPALFADWEYLPLGAPSSQNPNLYPGVSTGDYLRNNTEADIGLSYLIERGKKRERRYQAAKDVTAQTRSLVADNERALTYQVATLFVSVQLAESTIDFAQQDLKSFQKTVDIGEFQFKSGGISESNYLMIEIQLLQFQMDLESAQLANPCPPITTWWTRSITCR
jgi:outer membrane protein, heavy metal efflux system